VVSDRPRRWGIDERAAFLTTVRLFERLPASTLRALAAHLSVRQVQRGRFIFAEGEPADALYILAAGRVKVVRQTEDGREVILRVIALGEIFGGAGGWGEPVYPAGAVALEAVTALRLPAASFTTLIATSPDFALAVVRELGARLREAEARIRELQTERVERRIARTLLRLAGKTGTKTARGIELGLPLSRQDVAELAGTTLSTASRILSAWDERGIIVAGRERVVIRAPHLLVVIAEELPPDARPEPEKVPDTQG
jgi:CRP-like cAMP-binding protein